MPKTREVTIIEVGPRDGLQNEAVFVTTAEKIKLINALIDSGLSAIEVTSFVSAKAIAQLADNEAVFQGIQRPAGVALSALVPNARGMQTAIDCNVQEIAIFTAASESFNQRNIHCSIEESVARFIPVMALAKAHKIKVRGYISCVLGCPYEGSINPEKVLAVAKSLLAQGVDEISLGDTIGVGTVKQTRALIKVISEEIALSQVAMHFHDTYGQAIANISSSYELGIRRFDSSVAGLGGCPYAQGATGNVATEDLLYLMHGLGVETGVDIYKVVSAGEAICQYLGRANQSKVAKALLGNRCQ